MDNHIATPFFSFVKSLVNSGDKTINRFSRYMFSYAYTGSKTNAVSIVPLDDNIMTSTADLLGNFTGSRQIGVG